MLSSSCKIVAGRSFSVSLLDGCAYNAGKTFLSSLSSSSSSSTSFRRVVLPSTSILHAGGRCPHYGYGAAGAVRQINSSALTIEQNTSPKKKTPKEDLVFGTTFTDHMLVVKWDLEKKWSDPKIVPFQDLKLNPAASVLHYGTECFEGMKAYKSLTDDKSLRLFRPDRNMVRLSKSMERLQFACHDFDQQELIKCIEELVKLDQDWIPEGEGYSLYIRPAIIATNPAFGLVEPKEALLFVVCSPVGPYYKTGFKPVRLTADTPYIRAWPGGTGQAKVGGNYAPSMKASSEANAAGYNQVLWVFPNEKDGENYITEVGAMNVFFVIEQEDTKKLELVTPPLSRGDILPGVTRSSILDLERTRGEMLVSERDISMSEIIKSSKEGRLKEAFGAGTAAVVSPIECIQYKGEDILIDAPGKVTLKVWDEVTGIQYGSIDGPEGWSVVVK